MPRSETTPRPGSIQVVVYRYAIVGDLPECVIEEMQRAHRLQQKLVEIERRHEKQVAAVWAAHPDIQAAQEQLAEAEKAVEELRRAAAEARQKNRTSRTPPELTARLKEARERRRRAKETLKTTKNAAYPQIKAAMLERRNQRSAEIKATYREAVDGGLYWATYNDVLTAHKTAVGNVTSKRRQGQPAELRHRRWDGTGRIAVQLQREAGDPPRTPHLLASGEGKWRNVFQLRPWIPPQEWEKLTRAQQRRARLGECTFRIGSGQHAQQVTVPVIVHRPLPPDADVVMARITRRRRPVPSKHGGAFEASVSVTARVPAPAPRTRGPLAAMHIGWRSLPDGALRVAVVTGTGPVPDRLTEVVRDHGGWAEVVVPASWRRVHDRIAEVRSQRDRNLEALKAWLLRWLDEHPQARALLDPDGTLHSWRAPRRFARLAIEHRDDPPPAIADAIARIEDWRRQDKHLWTWEANERDQLTRRRNHMWRQVAAWITATSACLVLDGWELQQLARVPEDDDDPQARAARANRVLAAPAELRGAVEQAAQARGVRVVVPENELGVCCTCGTPLDRDQRARQIMVWCSTCEEVVDQDYNALQILLAAVRSP